MRLFHSEMLHTADPHRPTRSYRQPAYGARYDRRAPRAHVPALALEPVPDAKGAVPASPREILFRIAAFDRAA